MAADTAGVASSEEVASSAFLDFFAGPAPGEGATSVATALGAATETAAASPDASDVRFALGLGVAPLLAPLVAVGADAALKEMKEGVEEEEEVVGFLYGDAATRAAAVVAFAAGAGALPLLDPLADPNWGFDVPQTLAEEVAGGF